MRLRLPQRQRPVPEEGLTTFELAASRFNASEAGHTVCGLVRTLGSPKVSVGAAAGTAEEARVTVAWELTWYQWGVCLGEERLPVREIASGREIGELDYAARQWNAAATAEGRVVIAAPGR
ncbi:MAG TPA: hypothetical protein VMT37_10015 [Solirubrobacterales bacterium]|nr:hypothetical protein [Solirubrobacterales bacterium]